MNATMEEHIVFFSAIYKGSFPNIDNNAIISEIDIMKNNDSGAQHSNCGGWQSHDILSTINNYPEIDKLAGHLANSASLVWDAWQISSTPPELTRFWCNVNGYKDYNVAHDHPESVISGVYYVNSNNDSGKIVFIRPDNQRLFFRAGNMNQYNFETMSYLPESGDFYLFPSYLSHLVEPNMSNDDRISIAFNFS